MERLIIVFAVLAVCGLVGFIFCACKVASWSDAQMIEYQKRHRIKKLEINKSYSKVTKRLVKKMNEIIDYINEV